MLLHFYRQISSCIYTKYSTQITSIPFWITYCPNSNTTCPKNTFLYTLLSCILLHLWLNCRNIEHNWISGFVNIHIMCLWHKNKLKKKRVLSKYSKFLLLLFCGKKKSFDRWKTVYAVIYNLTLSVTLNNFILKPNQWRQEIRESVARATKMNQEINVFWFDKMEIKQRFKKLVFLQKTA